MTEKNKYQKKCLILICELHNSGVIRIEELRPSDYVIFFLDGDKFTESIDQHLYYMLLQLK